MHRIKMVDISLFKPHEKICEIRLQNLHNEITKDKVLRDPIIADKKTLVILDGHHRYNVLRSLAAKFCPCFLVDYLSDEINVVCWRANEEITKAQVMAAAFTGKLLPVKTSRHIIPDRPLGLDIPLEELY